MAISRRFQIPANDDDFEEICLELLRRHWSRPGLDLFGKRGERQFGIDILDLGGETPLYAAQCKLKEEHKYLQPQEIRDEVEKARAFVPALGKYAILTTGKVSTQSQLAIREINQSHKAEGLFEVEFLPWEKLCQLLEHYDDVRERFYGSVGVERAARIEAHLLHIKDGVDSLTSQSAGGEIDSKINDARDCINEKEFQIATLLLNRIQRSAPLLTARQKFRVLSNHGAAALGLGKANDAARYFLEAAAIQPEDEQGQVNEVLAYLLTGDFSAGHARANVLRQKYPASGRLAALWVTSSPEAVTALEMESTIGPILRTDPEVSVALARKAFRDLDFSRASEYANAAIEAAPQWAQAHLVAAESAMGKGFHLSTGPIRDAQRTLFQDAFDSCSRGLEVARAQRDRPSEIAALVQRVNILLLLDRGDEAKKDAEDARSLDPNDARVLLALAQVRLAHRQVDEGIALLARARTARTDFDLSFVYAKAMFDRGKDGDVAAALKILREISISSLPPPVRAPVASQVIQCFAKGKEWAEAATYLEGVSEFLVPADGLILRGYLAHFQGLTAEAERYASEAMSLLPPTVGADTKEVLARLFGLLGRHAEALPLWENLFELDQPGFDTGHLLNCAARLHRDDVVLKTCARLHDRNLGDWHLLEFEVPYLQKYDINTAIERLEGFIESHPDHLLAKLQLSMIGILLDRPELVRAEVKHLPDVTELPLRYVIPAIQVLRFGGRPAEAVDFAYRYLRDHFGDIEAHQALLMSMMPGFSSPEIPPSLDVVAAGSAVCYQENPDAALTWVVLEDTRQPKSEFEEISLASPLAEALLGKRVGDTAIIAKGRVQDRAATVKLILPKYVRRYQDSMTEMQVRFGSASPVESVKFGGPEDPSGGKGIEILKDWAKQRADTVAEISGIYENTAISLHLFGKRLGHNAYIALCGLARDPNQRLKCSIGSPDEYAQAVRSMQTAKAIVVDITALATLRMLGLTKVLSTSKRFIVSQHTRITLHQMLTAAKATATAAPGLTLSYEDGQTTATPREVNEEERELQEDAEFIKFIESHTDYRSGQSLAALRPEHRELLEKIFGQYGAESIAIAADPDLVLWTDDLIQAQLSAAEFGARRVWTQIVLGHFAEAGLISTDEYAEASARLIGMHFVATYFDAFTLLAGFRLAEWSPQRWPATESLKVFADPTGDLPKLFGVFVSFVERLYREPISSGERCAIARSFFDALADKPSALNALTSLREASARVFGLNVVGQQQFADCLDRWLKRENNSLKLLR